MKPLGWALVALAAYEAVVGLSELAWVSSGSTALAKVASFPSVASLVDTPLNSIATSNTNYIEGAIDLAIAAIAATYVVKGMGKV